MCRVTASRTLCGGRGVSEHVRYVGLGDAHAESQYTDGTGCSPEQSGYPCVHGGFSLVSQWGIDCRAEIRLEDSSGEDEPAADGSSVSGL